MITRTTGFAALIVAATGVVGGCAGDAELATEMGIPEVYEMQEARAEAARMTEGLDAPEVSRTVEGGVTVIRGTAPGQFHAIASTMAIGEEAARAAEAAEPAPAAPAPGAMVAPDQLAMLAAPPAVPVTPVSGRPLASELAPAAGGAPAQLAEVQHDTQLEPVSIETLEARGAVRLTTEDIEALSVGNTITHTNAETGFSVSTYYHPGGESRLINGDRGLPSRYQIGDGLRCRINMQGIGVCALLYRDGDTTWICEQGDEGMCTWFVSRVTPGYILG